MIQLILTFYHAYLSCNSLPEVPLKGSLKESSLPTNKSNVEVAERFMFESEGTCMSHEFTSLYYLLLSGQ